MLQRKHRAFPCTCLLLALEKAALRVLQTGTTAAARTLEALRSHPARCAPSPELSPAALGALAGCHGEQDLSIHRRGRAASIKTNP